MGFEEDFKKLVRDASSESVIDLARRSNVSQASLSMLVSGKRDGLQLSSVGKLIDTIGAKLVFNDEPIEGNNADTNDYVMVPKAKAVAGAGGSLETDEGSTGLYAFRREFLLRERIHTTNLRMMQIRGDSMEPTIKDGDTVLVDQSDTALTDGRIFIIGVDDELMCKRAAKIPGGWRFCSENKERPDIDVTGDELERLRVYGRVRWFGRVLA